MKPARHELCGPDCRYRVLYESTQASLSDLASKQATVLARYGRLRNTVITTLKAMMPRRFQELESSAKVRMSEVDDDVFVSYLQWLLSSPDTNDTPAAYIELRTALMEAGIDVSSTNPADWAASIRQRMHDPWRSAATQSTSSTPNGSLRELFPPGATSTTAPMPASQPLVEPVKEATRTPVVQSPVQPTPQASPASTPVVTGWDSSTGSSLDDLFDDNEDFPLPASLSSEPQQVVQPSTSTDAPLTASDPSKPMADDPVPRRDAAVPEVPEVPEVLRDDLTEDSPVVAAHLDAAPLDEAQVHAPVLNNDGAHDFTDDSPLDDSPLDDSPLDDSPLDDFADESPLGDFANDAPLDTSEAAADDEATDWDDSAFDDFPAVEPTASAEDQEEQEEPQTPAPSFVQPTEPPPHSAPLQAHASSPSPLAGMTPSPTTNPPTTQLPAQGIESQQPTSTLGSLFDTPTKQDSPPKLARQQALRPEVVTPSSAVNKRSRKRAAKQATLPDLDVPSVLIPPVVNEEALAAIDALVAIPRPVFTSDLVQQTTSAELVDSWQEARRGHAGQVTFIAPKRRHRLRGSLILPTGWLRDAQFEFQHSWWAEIVNTKAFRGAIIYELAVLLHRVGAQVVSYRVNAHHQTVMLRLRSSRGVIGVVVAVGADLDTDGATRAALCHDVEELFRERCELIVALSITDAGLESVIAALDAEAQQRHWRPPCHVVAAHSWEYADGAVTALRHVLG